MAASGTTERQQKKYLHLLTEVQLEDMSVEEVVRELKHAYDTGVQDGSNHESDKKAGDEDMASDLVRAYKAGKLEGWKELHPGRKPPKEMTP